MANEIPISGPQEEPKSSDHAVEEKFDEEKEKDILKSNLLTLNREDKIREDDVAYVQASLKNTDTSLSKLEAITPQDPDLKMLRLMWADLKRDFENNLPLQLDESFKETVALMQKEIAEKGVKMESIRDTALDEQIAALEKLGIKPAYVVRPDPPSEKTLILYMQLHPNPGMSQEFKDVGGITASQGQIEKEVSLLIEGGGVKNVYMEGFGKNEEFTAKPKDESDLKDMAEYQLEKTFGDRVKTIGTESRQLYFDEIEGRSLKYRMTAQNVIIAQNTTEEFLQSDQDTAVLIFGAGHEGNLGTPGTEHPLPLSSVLAYYGCNVIVVDSATQYLNLTGAMAVLEKEKAQKVLDQAAGAKN